MVVGVGRVPGTAVISGVGTAAAPAVAFVTISASMSWSDGIIMGGVVGRRGAAVTGLGRESDGRGAGGGKAAEAARAVAAAAAAAAGVAGGRCAAPCSRIRFRLSGS